MMRRLLLFVAMTAPLWAQGGGGGPGREAPVKAVPFERILRADDEPQNWLTYSGGLDSRRHSPLTQISPENARDLKLSWVFQSRSLEKHEVTPLIVDGVLYTVQSPNDVFALDAATGKTIWQYSHRPRGRHPDSLEVVAWPGDPRRQTVSRGSRCQADRARCEDRQDAMDDSRCRPETAIFVHGCADRS